MVNGKGDKNRTSNYKSYWNSKFWEKKVTDLEKLKNVVDELNTKDDGGDGSTIGIKESEDEWTSNRYSPKN